MRVWVLDHTNGKYSVIAREQSRVREEYEEVYATEAEATRAYERVNPFVWCLTGLLAPRVYQERLDSVGNAFVYETEAEARAAYNDALVDASTYNWDHEDGGEHANSL